MGKVAKVVVGANYGDEGKGICTDFLASELGPKTVVVRFNGGSQAGHTVVTPQGIRHVFGHFGSGTLAGCRTHLSRYFIVNPITFSKERLELVKKGFYPRVTVDPNAIVTTYYDMLLNQLSERSIGRKASCGLGINETVTRSENDEFKITVQDLLNNKYKQKISKMLYDWIPYRMKELKIDKTSLSDSEKEVITLGSERSKILLDRAMEEELGFNAKVLMIDDTYLSEVDNIIFEGAQGLLLDQNHDNFPWVTRSNTGITNVIDLFDDADLTYLDVYYVTRSYLTRHGDGPLLNSFDFPLYPNISDKTNITNKYQGSLRFAPLKVDLFLKEISKDIDKSAQQDIPCYINIAITCLDQVPTEVQEYIISGISKIGYPFITSYGPTRNDIRKTK